MDGPFLIPLAVFGAVCVIVAITSLGKISEKENEVSNSLRLEELDHRRRMAELEQQLAQIKKG
jgi:Na+/citrate or Na+/malate symporter